MKKKGNDRYILCGGAPLSRIAQKGKTVFLNLWGKDKNVTLEITDISDKLITSIPNRFIDLLEIATYIYCADQALTRGGTGVKEFGRKWRRNCRFYIPVRDYKFWSSAPVKSALEETLSFLTDDEHRFVFRNLRSAPSVKEYLKFPSGPDFTLPVDDVLLFSGGLDSLAGAVQELFTNNRRVALVSHRSTWKLYPVQRDLVKELRDRCEQRLKPLHIPVWINKDRHLSHESTQRSRSFLYASLGAVVAEMFGLSSFRFYENGIVTFNLPVSEQLIGGRVSRGTHPQAVAGFAHLFSLLTEKSFTVEQPFMWKTRAEIINVFKQNSCGDLIKQSRSCIRVYESTKQYPHCGVCSQCVDRRFGALAAGLTDNEEPAAMYETDLLIGDLEGNVPRNLVLSHVLKARKIDKMNEVDFLTAYGEVSRILGNLPESTAEILKKLFDLHKRNASEILGVLEAAWVQQGRKFLNGELSANCLLALCLPEKYKIQRVADEKGNIVRKEGELWLLSFSGTAIRSPDYKGISYIQRLLQSPGESFHVLKLLAEVEGVANILPDDHFSQMTEEQLDEELLRSTNLEHNSIPLPKEVQTAYKKSIPNLRQKLTDAEKRGQHQLADELRHQIGQVEKALADNASILKGRKSPDSATEKARKSITKNIDTAINRILPNHTPLGDHLRNYIRTGTYLTYTPPTSKRVAWNL